VTAKSRYNAAGFRKLQKSGFTHFSKILFVTESFFITKTVTNVITNVIICDFAKSGHYEALY
jgi:hypothetical protein